MKIVFMGTPEFAVPSLNGIYNSGHTISLVITQRDKPKGRGKKVLPTPVKEKALALGLEVYQPDSVNSKESIERLKEINPDCIVVAAFGQILKEGVSNAAKYGCLNVHASLLPKYRGAAPINWAVINGEEKTGITIMKMDKGLDTGDILKIREIKIEEDDDSSTIADKLAKLGGELIVETLADLENGSITPIPQDDKLASYAPMLSKEIGRIDWSSNGENIRNLVRGLKPWPLAYTHYDGENIKIHKVRKVQKFSDKPNGTVVKVSDEGIFVNCNDSCIVIEELQFPGKKKLHVSEYLRGNQFQEGVILG